MDINFPELHIMPLHLQLPLGCKPKSFINYIFNITLAFTPSFARLKKCNEALGEASRGEAIFIARMSFLFTKLCVNCFKHASGREIKLKCK